MKRIIKLIAFVGTFFSGLISGILIRDAVSESKEKKEIEFHDRFLDGFDILNKWMYMKQHGYELGEFLSNQGISKIAVYGECELCDRIIDELDGSDVHIKMVLDKSGIQLVGYDIPCYSLEDAGNKFELEELNDLDMVVVALVNYFVPVYRDINDISNVKVKSIKEVIDDFYLNV